MKKRKLPHRKARRRIEKHDVNSTAKGQRHWAGK